MRRSPLVLAFLVTACTATPATGPVAASPDTASPDAGTIAVDACPPGGCVQAPSCTDGVKNGPEVGVDCGGTCGPCPLGATCQASADCASQFCSQGLCTQVGRLLGPGGGPGTVKWTTILDQKLADPTALAFSPTAQGELWIANRGDGSLVIRPGATSASQGPVHRYKDSALHFLERVDALSFSDNGTFATCGDTRNDYHGKADPNDFMGPVLWPSELSDYQDLGPNAAEVHLDMMHDSPWCMGIAAETASRYFVVNGKLGTIDWYDFGTPHVHGGDDHTDGGKRRYKGVGLARVPGVPSHLAFDAATGWLYIADTGNDRIVRLDTNSGSPAGKIKLYPDEVAMDIRGGATLEVIVTGVDQPSGLVLHEGFLYFTEAGSGVLQALSVDGKLGNALDTGLGPDALAGLAVGPDERLYLVDRKGQRVLRVDVP